MTEKEIAKVLRRAKVKTDSLVCHDCAIMWEAADALKSLTAERDALKEQLAAALPENTKLAGQVQADNCTQQPDEAQKFNPLQGHCVGCIWTFEDPEKYCDGCIRYVCEADFTDKYARKPEAGEKE